MKANHSGKVYVHKNFSSHSFTLGFLIVIFLLVYKQMTFNFQKLFSFLVIKFKKQLNLWIETEDGLWSGSILVVSSMIGCS